MDKMTSTAFRVTLMNLERPVEVTVHGRVIGTWTPVGQIADPEADYQALVKSVTKKSVNTPTTPRPAMSMFTPAPKPGTSRR